MKNSPKKSGIVALLQTCHLLLSNLESSYLESRNKLITSLKYQPPKLH